MDIKNLKYIYIYMFKITIIEFIGILVLTTLYNRFIIDSQSFIKLIFFNIILIILNYYAIRFLLKLLRKKL